MRDKPTAVIHIGVEKTGTSSIQRFLEGNREALLNEGKLYPSFPRNERGSQWGLVARISDRVLGVDVSQYLGLRNRSELDDYRRQVDVSLDRQIKQAQNLRFLIVSSEHFHSRLKNRAEIELLRDYMGRWCGDFKILMYIRRQDRLAVSRFSTALKSGSVDWEVFPAIGDELTYYFDFWAIYRNWARVFGADQVQVGIFEVDQLEHSDIVRDFSGRAGIGVENKSWPGRVNESLNKAGADFVRELNRRIPVTEGGLRNAARERIVSLVAQVCSGGGRLLPAAREEAIRFYRAFSDSNAELARAVFPERVNGLFSEDFSEYPETREWPKPKYADAVGIAIDAIQRAAKWDEARQLRANNFHLRGMLALKDGNADRAIEMFQAVLQIAPEHFGANFQLARLRLERGEVEGGRKHLDAAIASAPPDHEGLAQLRRKYRTGR